MAVSEANQLALARCSSVSSRRNCACIDGPATAAPSQAPSAKAITPASTKALALASANAPARPIGEATNARTPHAGQAATLLADHAPTHRVLASAPCRTKASLATNAATATTWMTRRKHAGSSKQQATATGLTLAQRTATYLANVTAAPWPGTFPAATVAAPSAQLTFVRLVVVLGSRVSSVRLAPSAPPAAPMPAEAVMVAPATRSVLTARSVTQGPFTAEAAWTMWTRCAGVSRAKLTSACGVSHVSMSAACTQCPTGFYISGGCDGIDDSVCSPCSTTCPRGMSPVGPCGAGSDIVCDGQSCLC